jgi:hypothetical protein
VDHPKPQFPQLSNSIPSAVSLKFIEEQPQILRLATPELKNVRGPVRSANDSQFFVPYFKLRTLAGRTGRTS